MSMRNRNKYNFFRIYLHFIQKWCIIEQSEVPCQKEVRCRGNFRIHLSEKIFRKRT